MQFSRLFAAALLAGSTSLALATDVDVNLDVDANAKTEARIHEIDATAKAAIEQLTGMNETYDEMFDDAHGYAVFDSTKAGLVVTGAGGTGVAVDRVSGNRIYMRMAGAGLGLGAGAQTYQLVLLFENESSFEQFTNGDWNGNASVQAVAGETGANASVDFENGVAAFQIGQKGLMAQADLSGVKFWVADGLETDNS